MPGDLGSLASGVSLLTMVSATRVAGHPHHHQRSVAETSRGRTATEQKTVDLACVVGGDSGVFGEVTCEISEQSKPGPEHSGRIRQFGSEGSVPGG